MAKKQMKKENWKEVIDKMWPKTKKELEKALQNTKALIGKGEEYIKGVSEKGAKQARKLSLSLKREKLYYNLGKGMVKVSPSQWSKSKKIDSAVKEIKNISKEIKRIK